MAQSVRDRYSDKTFTEAMERLRVYGITNIIRPTGFGKSYILAKITSSKYYGKYRYNKCLYLYPLDIIKKDISKKYGDNTKEPHLHNTDFVSYSSLNRIRDKGYKYSKSGEVLTLEEFIGQYDLVMCDECHLCGAEGFKACWSRISDLFGVDKIHLIGVTASPNRMDSFDVIGEIFGGEMQGVFRISDQEAFRVGLLKEPKWVLPIYDKEAFRDSILNSVDEGIQKSLSASKSDTDEMVKHLDNIEKMDKTIGEVLEELRPNFKYLKFITFYTDRAKLFEQYEMVHNWFEHLYSDSGFEVHDHIIVSSVDSEICTDEDKKLLAGFEELNSLTEKDFVIDLIHCVDMLNMGYHVDDISGVIMLRGTRSEIIQIQQVGRCYSVNAKESPIIFDCVCNISTRKWFKGDGKNDNSLGDYDIDITRSTAVNGSDTLRTCKMGNGMDVYVTGHTFVAMKDMYRIIERKAYQERVNTDELMFWYYKLKAPIYVIAAKFKMSYDDTLKTLKKIGINIQPENKIEETLERCDSIRNTRDLEYNARNIVNSIFQSKGIVDKEMKLYIRKKRDTSGKEE